MFVLAVSGACLTFSADWLSGETLNTQYSGQMASPTAVYGQGAADRQCQTLLQWLKGDIERLGWGLVAIVVISGKFLQQLIRLLLGLDATPFTH